MAIGGGFAYGAYALYVGYVLGLGVPGWTSMVILLILLLGAVLLAIGVVGEYVGRIYEEVKRRPLYLVRPSLVRPAASERTVAEPVADQTEIR